MDLVGNTGEGGELGRERKGVDRKGLGRGMHGLPQPTVLHCVVLKKNHLLVLKGHDQQKS